MARGFGELADGTEDHAGGHRPMAPVRPFLPFLSIQPSVHRVCVCVLASIASITRERGLMSTEDHDFERHREFSQ